MSYVRQIDNYYKDYSNDNTIIIIYIYIYTKILQNNNTIRLQYYKATMDATFVCYKKFSFFSFLLFGSHKVLDYVLFPKNMRENAKEKNTKRKVERKKK